MIWDLVVQESLLQASPFSPTFSGRHYFLKFSRPPKHCRGPSLQQVKDRTDSCQIHTTAKSQYLNVLCIPPCLCLSVCVSFSSPPSLSPPCVCVCVVCLSVFLSLHNNTDIKSYMYTVYEYMDHVASIFLENPN